jgi:hypothetical protein
VGLGIVVFAEFAGGAGGIEVSKTGVAQTMNTVHPGEHALDQEFRFAIGVGGMKRRIFRNRSGFGIAVEGGGGGENEALDTGTQHRFQQGEGVGGIVAEKTLGRFHGLAGFDEGGEVHHGVELTFAEGFCETIGVSEVADDEIGALDDGLAVSVAEIVEDGDGMALANEFGDGDASDVSGSASDEDFQGVLPKSDFQLKGRLCPVRGDGST